MINSWLSRSDIDTLLRLPHWLTSTTPYINPPTLPPRLNSFRPWLPRTIRRTAPGFPGRSSSKVCPVVYELYSKYVTDSSRALSTSKTSAPSVQHTLRSSRYSSSLSSLPFPPSCRLGFAACPPFHLPSCLSVAVEHGASCLTDFLIGN